MQRYPFPYRSAFYPDRDYLDDLDDDYLRSLRTFAGICGYDQEAVDDWLMEGFTTDEIEDFLYCGEEWEEDGYDRTYR